MSQNVFKLSVLLNCINSIKDWMADNCLQLNSDETEVHISAPEGGDPKGLESLGSLSSPVKLVQSRCFYEPGFQSWLALVFYKDLTWR